MGKLLMEIIRDIIGMLVICAGYVYCMARAVDEIGLYTTLMITLGFLMIINLIKSWSRLK